MNRRLFRILIALICLSYMDLSLASDRPDARELARTLVPKDLVSQLSDLPTAGAVARTPWTGSYWPIMKGGLGTPAYILDVLHQHERELTLFRAFERPEIYSRLIPRWYGFCDAWAAAAISFPEPQPVTVIRADGEKINLTSGEVKALLMVQYLANRKYDEAIKYHDWWNDILGRRAHELDPGTFHLVLANLVGLQKKSFVIDSRRIHVVSNHPVISYRTTVQTSLRGAYVQTEIQYVDYTFDPDLEPVLGTDRQKTKSATYRYHLNLDSNGSVTGGRWISIRRPDSAWIPKPEHFSSRFAASSIYSRSPEKVFLNILPSDLVRTEKNQVIDLQTISASEDQQID